MGGYEPLWRIMVFINLVVQTEQFWENGLEEHIKNHLWPLLKGLADTDTDTDTILVLQGAHAMLRNRSCKCQSYFMT